jgi:hypothetical protein
MAISTAFVFDTIPYIKTVEKMTNPCFQNTEFTTLMKGKHVTNTREETMLESVGEVSGIEKENVNDEENDEFNAGGDNWFLNDEMKQSDPIANLLSQAAIEENQNPTTGKRTRKRRPTPDNQNIRRGKCLRTITDRFAPSSRTTVQFQP